MGDFMVLFVPMTAALAYYAEKPSQKLFAWLSTLCMCFACLFTMSRAAWVAMAVAIILFILLVDRRLFLLLAAGLALLVLIPFVRTRIGFLFTQDFIDANTNGGAAADGRLGWSCCRPTASGRAWGTACSAARSRCRTRCSITCSISISITTISKPSWKPAISGYGLHHHAARHDRGLLPEHLQNRQAVESQAKPELSTRVRHVLWPSRRAGALLLENIFEEPYMMVYFWAIAAMIVYFGFLRDEKKEAQA